MAHTNTTTKGIRTLLASTVVALGIGAPTLGVAGAAEDAVTAITTTTAATVTTTAPARQEPPAASVAHRVELDEALILAEAPEQVDLVIWALGRYEEAGELLDKITADEEFVDFLTLAAYEVID